jgi:hypothetical protein
MPKLVRADPLFNDRQLHAAMTARLKRNPVANEFAVPLLERQGGVTIDIRGEAEEPRLKDAWANFSRDSKLFVLNRDAVNADFQELNSLHAGDPSWKPLSLLAAGRALDPRQIETVVDRYMPIVAHEVGGHARNYQELAQILGTPAPNVRETEIDALWLEAMTVAAERRTSTDYLKDGAPYGVAESGLVTRYWETKERHDPGVFRDFIDGVPGYRKIASAFDEEKAAAMPAVAAYYKQDLQRLNQEDLMIVGDAPPDGEENAGRRDFMRDEPRFMRR